MSYAGKIADGKYCNDRNIGQSASDDDYATIWSANGTKFRYAGSTRLWLDYAPTLSCDLGDIYTLKVGLITADESVMAGGKGRVDNVNYYLYNGLDYWTMSPDQWNSGASLFVLGSDGYITNAIPTYSCALRPVINLQSNVTFSGGNGTQSNPYIVQ